MQRIENLFPTDLENLEEIFVTINFWDRARAESRHYGGHFARQSEAVSVGRRKMNTWTNPGPHLGLLPLIIFDADPRPVSEQIHERYAHGGGFQPFEGFSLVESPSGYELHYYPDDPPMREKSRTQIRDETVVLFEYSWVAVIRGPDNWQVCRMD